MLQDTSEIVEVTDKDDFEHYLSCADERLVLALFSSKSIDDELAEAQTTLKSAVKPYEDKVLCLQVDSDLQDDIRSEYQVEGSPVFVIIRDGQEWARIKGCNSEELAEKLKVIV